MREHVQGVAGAPGAGRAREANAPIEPNASADALETARGQIGIVFTQPANSKKNKITAATIVKGMERVLASARGEWPSALAGRCTALIPDDRYRAASGFHIEIALPLVSERNNVAELRPDADHPRPQAPACQAGGAIAAKPEKARSIIVLSPWRSVDRVALIARISDRMFSHGV